MLPTNQTKSQSIEHEFAMITQTQKQTQQEQEQVPSSLIDANYVLDQALKLAEIRNINLDQALTCLQLAKMKNLGVSIKS